jgi:hypothetical protein
VEQSGYGHAAEGGKNGQGRVFQVGEFANIKFPFNFKTNHEEKNGHQAIVNPVFHAIFQINVT